MDQPMTRRERRERERAAEAAARAQAGGSEGAGPRSGAPQQGQVPQQGQSDWHTQAQPPQSWGAQPARSSQPAQPSQPAQQQNAWNSQQQAPQQPQAASSRPVIRPASRTQGRVGSGPNHQPSHHQPSHHPQGAQQTAAYPASGRQTFLSPPADAPTHTQPGAGATQAMPVATASAAAAGTATAGRGGGGAKRTNRKRQTEYEPLGPVRGTIRAFGELCITAGLILILFVVWQLWWTDIAANKDNEVLADQLITEWRDNPANELPDDPDTPYVAEPVDENSGFGIMYVPRFGEDYYRTVAEGVSLEPVLNRMGVGRYPSSAMPGEVGNFAIAGHRVTYGKPLNQIHQLRPGDEIVVQTSDGFYTYTFRNFEIVLPDATEVLAAVPTLPEYKGKDRIMTLTACNPMFSARERYIAYAELTDWTPAGDGAPDSIADTSAYDKVGGDA